jgi:hypothetical protein
MLLRRFHACLFLCLALFLSSTSLSASEPVDAGAWGAYARLVDHTQQSEIGYRLHWRWGEPGKQLVEEWYDAYTGELSYTTTIVPGAQRGQLVLTSPKFGNKTWNGTVEPDGSVLYVGVGMLKAPYRVQVDADGRMAMVFVRIKGSEVTENFTTQYDHADARGLIPRPNAKSADPAVWGVYARLLGARLADKQWTGISWTWMGDTIVQDRGVMRGGKLQISPDGPGRLRMISGRPDEVWNGTIGVDGEVIWTSKHDSPSRMRIDGDEAVFDKVVLKDGKVVKSKSEARFKGNLPAMPIKS